MVFEVAYKSNIIPRMGGSNMFEFIVLSLVERLKADPELSSYFSTFDTGSLVVQEKQFLKAVFSEHPEDYDVDSFILLRHYGLISQGFNGKHYDLLVCHLVDAMEDAWVGSDVVEDAIRILKSFRRIFGNDTSSTEEEAAQTRFAFQRKTPCSRPAATTFRKTLRTKGSRPGAAQETQ